jgi:hypothetical protein
VRLPKQSADRKKREPIDTPRRTQQFRRCDLDALIENQIQPATSPTIRATKNNVLTSKRQIKPEWWKRASR